MSSTIVSKASAIRLEVQSNVQEYSFFFWARNAKVGEKPIFDQVFIFFLGKNRFSCPLYPAFWHFSRAFLSFSPTFDLFRGLKIQILGHNSEIFLGLKRQFLGNYSEIFLTIFFSCPYLKQVFYAKYPCTKKIKPYFSLVLCDLLGHNFSFFSWHYFCFLGCKFSKTFSGKHAFLGNFLGYFQFFSPAFLRFSPRNSKFFSGNLCFFSPNKINTASVLHTQWHIIFVEIGKKC